MMQDPCNEKAIAIPQRHKFTCDICMLIDSQDKTMKFHLYDEGFIEEKNKYVCNDCVEGIKEIRKNCGKKIDNPRHHSFDNFIPWFAKEVPGLVEAFTKQMS